MPTIYTAIFGDYDDLKTPLVITPGWRYICFTDADLHSPVWEIRKVQLSRGARRESKLYKIMFHEFIEDYFSVWMDASFYVNCDLQQWTQKHFVAPMTLMQHPTRRCVYDEALACIRNKRDNADVIREQIALYRRLGLPSMNGMAASGIMMRQKTEETIAFCRTWYNELCHGSVRDQISFAYAKWKHPIASLCNYNYRTGTDFLHMPHLKCTEKRALRLAHYKKLKLL